MLNYGWGHYIYKMSEPRFTFIPGRANNSIPEVKFKPEATEIVVAGSTVEFQCLFAG